MSTYTRSKQSKLDIYQITKRSAEIFGESQTLKYMTGLEEHMQLLARRPDIGRSFLHPRSEHSYLFFRYGRHIIYYRKRAHDIFIVRILHTRMLPENYL